MTVRLLMTTILLSSLTAVAVAGPRADAGVRRQTLPNGLTLLLAPDPHAGNIDVTVWYAAGTRWESAGRTGVTHLVEQLMFRGIPAGGDDDYISRIRRAGGTVGSESTPDYSSFFQSVPPEALGMVFEMEAERMSALSVSQARFDEARALVRQNRERAGNTPIVRGMQQLFADVFEGHPYAWPAIGLEQDLGAIDLHDCVAWHTERYGPANAVVTVTGRFDPADAIAAARRTFSKVKRRDVPRDIPTAMTDQATVYRTVGTYSFAGPSVLLGWRVPPALSVETPALELLARYLAGDGTAPLNRLLIGQDRPTAYVQSGLEARQDAGLFFALAALKPDADSAAVAGVERAILDEVAMIARDGVVADRFERVRKGLRVSRLFSSQRPRERAQALARAGLVLGGSGANSRNRKSLPEPSAADVQAAARRFLAGRQPVTVWMMPAGRPAGEVE